MKKPSQKYMEIVTVDDFDFWFMGFLNYQKAFKYLQQAVVSQSQRVEDEQVTFQVAYKIINLSRVFIKLFIVDETREKASV